MKHYLKLFLASVLLVLAASNALRADDIGNGSWQEDDTLNTAASPNGWPTGITGSGARDTGRGMMGAVKRWWDAINATVTTGGSANAQTYATTNTTYPTALITGQCITAKAGFTNTGAATFKVNSLTAKNIFKQTPAGPAALVGGEIQSGQHFTVCYDGTQYQLITQIPQGYTLLSTQTASASNTIAFTGLASTYDHYELRITAAVPTTNTDNLAVQFGTGATPTWSTTGNYAVARTAINSGNTTATAGTASQNGIILFGSASSSAAGAISGRILIPGSADTTQDHQVRAELTGFGSDGNYYVNTSGGAWTADQTAITAIRIFFTSSGAGALTADTIASGTFSLYGVAK